MLAAQTLLETLQAGLDSPHLAPEQDVADLVEALGLGLGDRGLGHVEAARLPLVGVVPGHGVLVVVGDGTRVVPEALTYCLVRGLARRCGAGRWRPWRTTDAAWR